MSLPAVRFQNTCQRRVISSPTERLDCYYSNDVTRYCCYYHQLLGSETHIMKQDDVESEAARAAEALEAEGLAVTARAVRQRAGVQMAVAAKVAREWKARAVAADAVPDMPDVVQARVEGLWAEAVRAARAEHAQAVVGWQSQVSQVEEERDEALVAIDEQVEAASVERERLQAENTRLQQDVDRLTSENQQAREDLETMSVERAAAREEAAEARGQINALREQLEAVREQADGDDSRSTE